MSTETKHQAAALQERTGSHAEERFRQAMGISTVGVLFFSLDGRITDANETFQHMSGYAREELLSCTHWKTLTPPEFYAVTQRAAEELATRGHTAPYEKEMIRKDGSRWWGLFAPTRLSGNGRSAECMEFIIDITDRKCAERALREADRRKDEFLATLAHELRNPLAPIRNGLQIARRSDSPNAPIQRIISMMDRQLSHLVRLVDDLLDVGRISAGKIHLSIERVSLRQVLANSLEGSRGLIDGQGHDVVVEACDEELCVLGDFDRLTQVFSNLLSNAAKYTEREGEIRIRLGRESDQAVVSVTDTGIGIPPEHLQHVFDLFSQVRTQQGRTEGGLGIGLALARNLVQMHDGTLEAESAGLGQGSTFIVRLPLLLDLPAARGIADARTSCN